MMRSDMILSYEIVPRYLSNSNVLFNFKRLVINIVSTCPTLKRACNKLNRV